MSWRRGQNPIDSAIRNVTETEEITSAETEEEIEVYEAEEAETPPSQEEECDFRCRLAASTGATAARSAVNPVEEATSRAVTREQQMEEDLSALSEVEETMNELGITTTEERVRNMERAIREIDQLRRIASGDACVDLEPPGGGEGEGPDGGNGPDPGPEGPEEDEIISTPFLVPRQHIDRGVSGADREVTVINRSIFDDQQWMLQPGDTTSFLYPKESFDILKTDFPENVDPFRGAAGKFWYFTGKEEEFGKRDLWATSIKNRSSVLFDTIIEEEFWENDRATWHTAYVLEFDTRRSSAFVDTYVNGKNSQYFDQLPPETKGRIAAPLIDSENSKKKFIDTVFSAEMPFYKKELDNMAVSQFTSVDINASVTTLDEQSIKETNRPSLYRAFWNKKNADVLETQLIQRLEQAVTIEEVNNIQSQIDALNAEAGLPLAIDCEYEDVIQKFSCEAVLQLQEANESYAGSFDNSVEIEINTQQGSKVASLLHEFRMDKHLLEMLTSTDVNLVTFTEVMDETLFGIADQATINDKVELRIPERVLDSVAERVRLVSNKTTEHYENIDTRQYPIPFENHDNPGLLRFSDTIRSQMFLSKLKNYLKTDKYRSFTDLMKGEKAYSEIIGYRIAKHEIVDNVVEPLAIQEFYLMDSDEIKTINFIDTQISTGKKYLYRIHSLNFVVGSLYKYGVTTGPIESSDGAVWEVSGIAETVPLFRIIEAPFFERVISTQEKPPLPPQVSFLPFQGVADKMQILLESNFGERLQTPVQILDTDAATISNMRASQDINEGDKIMYKNDSLPKSFQIMRLSTAPNSYGDFKNSDYIRTVNPSGRSFLYLEDDFEPNKDYYYIFREIDDLGFSNPTEVFRVKMVSYQNGIYMDLEAYEMIPPEESVLKISFEKALEIAPNLIQSSLKFDESLDLDSREFALTVPDGVDIGNNGENSVWGRTFKARITSRSSGRRIDINFKFVKNIEKRDPDTIESSTNGEGPCET